MKNIDNDIKTGNFKQVYLLYGEETYLLNQYRAKLKAALMGDGDAMNFTSFEGTAVSVDEVIDIAETMPFFAERRVVLLDHTGLFAVKKGKKSKGAKADGDAGSEAAAGESAVSGGGYAEKSIGTVGVAADGIGTMADGRNMAKSTGLAGGGYDVESTGTVGADAGDGTAEAGGSAAAAQLADYLGNMPDTTYMIFVEDTVDKRSRLFKTVAKCGYAAEFKPIRADVLARWVGSRVRSAGKNITQGAYECFIDRTGTEMENIDKELEKLLCYTMDRDVIREEDVRAIVTERTENRIFVMIDAIAEGRQKQALDLYYDLLSLKEAPMKILSLIDRQFQTLFVVKSMSNQGFPNKEIAARIGKQKQEWTVPKQYLPQCRRLSMEDIRQAMCKGAEYEEAVKTGRMGDQLAVELFIVDICHAAEAHT